MSIKTPKLLEDEKQELEKKVFSIPGITWNGKKFKPPKNRMDLGGDSASKAVLDERSERLY